MISPEIGFTSDVIRDPSRFIGRSDLISDCIRALNSPLGLIAVYGKRGVGKSSLLRQIQQLALGDYSLAREANLAHLVPKHPRKYLTVFYTCDGLIASGTELVSRLCNDQHPEDGLLRLLPDDGISEFRGIGITHGATDGHRHPLVDRCNFKFKTRSAGALDFYFHFKAWDSTGRCLVHLSG